MSDAAMSDRATTGIKGLDQILHGGFPRERMYMLRGGPGTGKTTTGLQFLLEGAERGERVVYLCLLQNRAEVEGVMASHGWPTDAVEIVELPEGVHESATREQTVFRTGEVELHEATDAIVDAIEEHQPHRLVLDSVSELAVLVNSPYQLRRQLVKVKKELEKVGCTAVFAVGIFDLELTSLQTLVHGLIHLEMESPAYGLPRRWLEVRKVRGSTYVGGYHDFRITTGGLEVYPRLQVRRAAEPEPVDPPLFRSGNEELDALLGGGLHEGSACLVTGTTGGGKSTLAGLYAEKAAEEGGRAAIFSFDERKDVFLQRARSLGMSLPRHVEEGRVDFFQYDVGGMSPGEFIQNVLEAVEQRDVKVVVIDSLTGYLNAMPDGRSLTLQLHDLLTDLGERGVLTLVVLATQSPFGTSESKVDVSYLTDTVVTMRHFEAHGLVRRCIAVLKKRAGPHEPSIREVESGPSGLRVGPPLENFSGVLTGTPTYGGPPEALMKGEGGARDEGAG